MLMADTPASPHLSLQMKLLIARALKLLVNDLVHFRARIDEGSCNNR